MVITERGATTGIMNWDDAVVGLHKGFVVGCDEGHTPGLAIDHLRGVHLVVFLQLADQFLGRLAGDVTQFARSNPYNMETIRGLDKRGGVQVL